MTFLLTWSVQALVLVAAGAIADLTLAHAKTRLIFWQSLLLILLLLPALEPWQGSPLLVVKPVPATVAVLPASMVVTRPGFSWRPEYWLLLIGAGTLLRIAWIATGFLRLRGYRQRATLLTGPPFRFASTSARWYVSDTVPGPVTYGWRRPTILLPARIMQLAPALREAIATHELIHVKRRDWLFVLAEEAVRSLLWFHPAVWYVLGRIQLAREQVVDGEVVRLTQDRDCYLEALVEVASQRLHPDLAPAPLFMRKRHLAERVSAVLKEVSMSKSHIAARLAAAFSSLFLVARVAILFVPFVSPGQTVLDDPGVTVDAGATLLHRAAVHNPAGASGTLTLEASLNAKGEVIDARVLSGPEDLRKEALSSVLQWHYSPGQSRVQISMRFDPGSRAVPLAAPLSPAPTPTPAEASAASNGRRAGAFVDAGSLPENSRIANIEVTGFSPEGERELRNRLPFHEGDPVSSADIARASAAVTEFDSHAHLGLTTGSLGTNSELRLGIRIATAASTAVRIGPGVTAPTLIYSPAPEYSEAAQKARFQGTVTLSMVVDTSGQPTSIKVVRSLGLGLDEKAIEAAETWRFKPGSKDGQPVAVTAAVEVNFRLPN